MQPNYNNGGEKPILDATCGSRMIWFDKRNPNCLYVDKRVLHGEAIWRSTKNNSIRRVDIEPDLVADFTALPFPDETFYLVVFDPPHLIKLGENSWLCKKYGKLPDNWQPVIHDGFHECLRVLKTNGTLIFKWNEYDIPLKDIIQAVGETPLFGHRSGKQAKTHWLCFMKGGNYMNEKQT